MQGFKNIWQNVVDELSKELSETAMNLWIKPIEPIKYESDCAVLVVESPFHRDIVMSKYRDVIRETFSRVVGFEIDINVLSADEYHHEKPKRTEEENNQEPVSRDSAVAVSLQKEYTFENFIVGDSNNHAYAACVAVANNPGTTYNPLFIYGNTGLGKTHLLHAIKNRILANNPSAKVLYIKSEDFINDFINMTQGGDRSEFKDKYRTLDVLLVDDIQFLAGKDSTQIEFFHTFNTLYENKKQIILTSDRPPRDIQVLDERLRSRFESGVTTDIYLPEYELKVAIIRQKAKLYNINLSEDVIDFIAQRIKNNIRQLEGVIKKLLAYKLISDTPISVPVAQSAIRDITNENEPIPVVVDKVITEVSREFNVSQDSIKSKSHKQEIAFARQIAMYILREITDMSLPEIGREFSGKDHSTVHYSIKKIEDMMEENNMLKIRIDEIISNIKNY